MKFDNLRAFKKHLKDSIPNHLSPLYLILSKEESERSSALQKLREAIFSGSSPREDDLRIFHGNKLRMERVLEELNSSTLFSIQRMVVIHDFDKVEKQECQKLQDYVKKPIPKVFLTLVAESLHRGSSIYTSMSKKGVILDIPELKTWEVERHLVEVVIELAKEQGKQLPQGVALQFVKTIGANRSFVANELTKLICYVGNRSDITCEDVQQICIYENSETIWQLGEAIFRLDVRQAIAICRALMLDSQQFYSLIRQIRKQFQTKLQIISILSSGGGTAEIQKLFPYMRGQILNTHTQLARMYGFKRLKKGIVAIDDLELLGKSQQISHELLMEKLVIQLTT